MSKFSEGDKVSWPHVSTARGGFRISTRTGRVLVDKGDETLLVNYRKIAIRVKRAGVRLEGQTTALTESLMAGGSGDV